MKKMEQRLIRCVLETTLVLLLVFPVLASPKTDYDSTMSQIDAIGNDLQTGEAELSIMQQEKDDLIENITVLETKISDLQAQIDKLDTEINERQAEQKGRRQELDDKYNVYHMQIRQAEEFGQASYLELLFQSSSLLDFLNRMDYISELMEYQENALLSIEPDMKEINEEYDYLAELRASRNNINIALKKTQVELYEAVELRISQIQELEHLNEERLNELDRLNAYAEVLLQRINGAEYEGSMDPAEIYQEYVIKNGGAARSPEGAAIVKYALQFIGYPYVWGGASPETGFDCSGLMYYVYGQFYYKLQRVAEPQYKYCGVYVDLDHLEAGDLVFFHPTGSNEISHVGMYIGEGVFLHAANRTDGVTVDSLYSTYYKSHYSGAKRIV